MPQTNKKKIINDPVYGFISIPNAFFYELIEHPSFQRLRRILQLGLTHLVYPGALHTRFHHALGAMHLMQKAVDVLRRKGIEISDDEEQADHEATDSARRPVRAALRQCRPVCCLPMP